jgi:hypothetical protein
VLGCTAVGGFFFVPTMANFCYAFACAFACALLGGSLSAALAVKKKS